MSARISGVTARRVWDSRGPPTVEAVLGANALIAVSTAVAQAAAGEPSVPLWPLLTAASPPTLPLPEVRILGGRAHTKRAMDLQDVMIIPVGAERYVQALDWAAEVTRAAGDILSEAGQLVGLADEGARHGEHPGACATGSCSGLLSTCVVATPQEVPVIFVPSLNEVMWTNPAVQRNVSTLRDLGHYVIEPDDGREVATIMLMHGAMPSLERVCSEILEIQARHAASRNHPAAALSRDLRSVLLRNARTAPPTA